MGEMRYAPGTPLEPQVVYGHRFPGDAKLFHIGSGTYRRALSKRPNKSWREYVGDRDVEVVILEKHACPARAKLRECELVAELKPITDEQRASGPSKQVLRGFIEDGVRCACGSKDCYGQEAVKLGL